MRAARPRSRLPRRVVRWARSRRHVHEHDRGVDGPAAQPRGDGAARDVLVAQHVQLGKCEMVHSASHTGKILRLLQQCSLISTGLTEAIRHPTS